MIGKKCIIRTYSAGVHYGELVTKDGTEVTLKNSIRIHYWKGACSLSQLAIDGPKDGDDCRFAMVLPEILVMGVIEIIPCSEEACKTIEGVKTWKI